MLSNNEIIKMIFGFKVKYLRQHLDLTYQQLAELSGMSLSYIHEVEKGKKYPKPDKISKLAKALGTDYDYLVSTQADKKIQPIIDLLTSDFLQIFPLGMFGIEEFTAIVNPPDACIMAVGTIVEKPVVKNGQIVVGNTMKVTLSCDHRVVDGAVGSAFLKSFRDYMENPLLLLGEASI